MWWENISLLGMVVYRNTFGMVGPSCKCIMCVCVCVFVCGLWLLTLIYSLFTTQQHELFLTPLLLSVFSLLDWFQKSKNYCLILVNDTDFALAWGADRIQLSCYKFRGRPGLQYKVGVCLQTSDIVLFGLVVRFFVDYTMIYKSFVLI